MLSRFKLTIAYDGTDFHGWQIQPNQVSVQSTLIRTFEKKFRQPVFILGASRTDAGVHASGQVALMKTELNLAPEKIVKAWSESLPKSVVVLSAEKVGEDFHPMRGVSSKLYTYDLFTQRPLPHMARFGWHHKHIRLLNQVVFEKTLSLFQGKHDFRFFSKFCAEEGRNPNRSVDMIKVERLTETQGYRISFVAKGFLRFQIRRMLGAAIAVGCWGKHCLQNITGALQGDERAAEKAPTFSAAGCGLTLRKINYH
jgi:tRNA pseudouridine38-40 synthase